MDKGVRVPGDTSVVNNISRARVIAVTKHLDRGGGVPSVLFQTLPLLRKRYDIRVLCYRKEGNGAEQFRDAGIPVDVLPLGSKWAPWNMARFVAYFRHHAPQIVHTHEYTANTFAVVAAARAGTPVRVRHLHSMALWGWGGWWKTWTRRRVDARTGLRAQMTLAVSQTVRDAYLTGNHLSPESCRVLLNGVDLERFGPQKGHPGRLREELDIPEGAPLVGIVGRLTLGKGHREFLRVCALVANELPQTRFLIVGDGGLRPELQRLAAELGIGDRAIFTGRRDDMPTVMSALDLLLFTSLADEKGRTEGMPLVLLEAQASGVPVVAFELPVLFEFLEHRLHGVFVRPGDVDAMAAETVKYLRTPALRASASVAAAENARRHGWKVWCAKMERIYDELLAKQVLDPR